MGVKTGVTGTKSYLSYVPQPSTVRPTPPRRPISVPSDRSTVSSRSSRHLTSRRPNPLHPLSPSLRVSSQPRHTHTQEGV